MQTIVKIVLPRDILRLSVHRIDHALLCNFQTRDYCSKPRHHPEEIWKGRLSSVGASLQSCLIVTVVIAICRTKSCEGSQFLFFHVLGNHFVMSGTTEALSSRYDRVGMWLILRVAEILGLDVQASDMIRAFVIDFETSWNPLMRLGKENFMLLRSSCRRPSQSVALLIACLLRLCYSWLLLSSSHGRLLTENCEARFKPLIEGSRYTMLTENHPN